MAKKQPTDEENRKELRKLLEEFTKEDEVLRKESDDFIEALKNGELKKTLDDFREVLQRRKRRLSSCNN